MSLHEADDDSNEWGLLRRRGGDVHCCHDGQLANSPCLGRKCCI